MEEYVVQMPSGRYLTLSQEDAYEIVSHMGGGCKPENMDSLAIDLINAYKFSWCPSAPSEYEYSKRRVSDSEVEDYMFHDIEKYGLDAVLSQLKEEAIHMMYCLNALGYHKRNVVDWGDALRKQQEANNRCRGIIIK